MSKKQSTFECQSCGALATKWMGQCPRCKEWNTIQEIKESTLTKPGSRNSWTGQVSKVELLEDVEIDHAIRYATGISELDRVLGGAGLVKGSVALLGGDPGIGKSTLLLQACANFANNNKKVLYTTGEESTSQVKDRATRLGVGNSKIYLYAETSLEEILKKVKEEEPDILIIDSIQTIYSEELHASAGTVSQVRECAAALTRVAKSTGMSVILIGHVTKEGELAGPQVLAHMVDTVLYFEGDKGASLRMVRAIKNRFGPAHELGLFLMGERGLEELLNPSEMLITPHDSPVSGSAIYAAVEGNRPFLVEIQALVEDSINPNAKRYASGVDTNKVQMLLAVLQKHCGISAYDKNVYVKSTGGVKIMDPGVDLPILCAIYSSLGGKTIGADFCFLGEVGLAGEIRPVSNFETRIKEAIRLGYTQIVIPKRSKTDITPVPSGVTVHEYSSCRELFKAKLF